MVWPSSSYLGYRARYSRAIADLPAPVYPSTAKPGGSLNTSASSCTLAIAFRMSLRPGKSTRMLSVIPTQASDGRSVTDALASTSFVGEYWHSNGELTESRLCVVLQWMIASERDYRVPRLSMSGLPSPARCHLRSGDLLPDRCPSGGA